MKMTIREFYNNPQYRHKQFFFKGRRVMAFTLGIKPGMADISFEDYGMLRIPETEIIEVEGMNISDVDKRLSLLSPEIMAWIRGGLIRNNKKFFEIVRGYHDLTLSQDPHRIFYTDFPDEPSRELLREYLLCLYVPQKKGESEIYQVIISHIDRWEAVYNELYFNRQRTKH